MTIILALLLSFILHALLEILYINDAIKREVVVSGNNFFGFGWCALPFWAWFTFPALGIFGGYFLGQFWWKVVYIEKRHWRFTNKKATP